MPSHTFLARARDSGLGEFLIPSRVLDPMWSFRPGVKWYVRLGQSRTRVFEYTHHHEGPQAV